ncbi:MAG: nucleotidyltransferase family protein [Candidatus Methylomirabilales bacterium]
MPDAGVIPEQVIVEAVTSAVGSKPVILCGSRATGEAVPASDYDLLVVLPLYRIPFDLPRLSEASERLAARLGVPVTVNPLPAFRLRRPGRSLLIWKLRREGRILSAPPGFDLGRIGKPNLTKEATSSYALSGIRFLLAGIQPEELVRGPLRPEVAQAVRKALLHAVQLRLLRQGGYASRLADALAGLEPDEEAEMSELARAADRPDSWFRVRDLLVPEVDQGGGSHGRALLANLQYLLLSAVRGRPRYLHALWDTTPIATRLARSAVLLARSIGSRGTIDAALVAEAAQALPPFLRPPSNIWSELRGVVETEWPIAAPLLGL